MTGLVVAGLIVTAAALLFAGRAKAAWIVPALAGSVALYFGVGPVLGTIALSVSIALAVGLGMPAVRRGVVTRPIMAFVSKILPVMSETERVALEAGTVWFDGDLFSGRPDFKKLLDTEPARLTDEEQAFLDGPVEELCRLATDFEIQENGTLPEPVWDFLKENRFFGMIIPKEYGGLGFSAFMHSSVVAKVASRSTAMSVTVMVPNSLGPAELLMHYGTDDQKNHYLPRLAKGEEIPCFALTEPNAGSDAGAISSYGVVEERTVDGQKQLGIRLNWDKRYITLSPVATLLGLAFQLRDPDGLLGDEKDLGITCALIPTNLEGVETGHRHDPLGCPFLNGPTKGHDVFVSVDRIIGGREMAGRGWMMLMQCLSVGRGISLPSLSAGGAQLATRTCGAYATVREQFGLPIGRFEGVQEALSRIAGMNYALESVRRVTAMSVDRGEKPSVVSAIAKCYSTEQMRFMVNDAMDVVGGAGISQGPRNILGNVYQTLPIGITVEGANILTRTMIIFGQGALRCHPFAQHEVRAVADNDLAAFDRAFFGHVGFVATTATRVVVHALTGGLFARVPVSGPLASRYRRLERTSAVFALCADAAMGTLGGALKRKERITGRLSDALSWMYIASATLKRFHDDGSPKEDQIFVTWAVDHALAESQKGIDRFLETLPHRPSAWALRILAYPFGRPNHEPGDRLAQKVAVAVLEGGEARERHTPVCFVPKKNEPGLGRLEHALDVVMASREAEQKIKDAIKAKKLDKGPKPTLVERAVEAKVITDAEANLLSEAKDARFEAITVDAVEGVNPSVQKVVGGDVGTGAQSVG